MPRALRTQQRSDHNLFQNGKPNKTVLIHVKHCTWISYVTKNVLDGFSHDLPQTTFHFALDQARLGETMWPKVQQSPHISVRYVRLKVNFSYVV